MIGKKRIEIVEWTPAVETTYVAKKPSQTRRQISPLAIGLLGTLFLHGVALLGSLHTRSISTVETSTVQTDKPRAIYERMELVMVDLLAQHSSSLEEAGFLTQSLSRKSLTQSLRHRQISPPTVAPLMIDSPAESSPAASAPTPADELRLKNLYSGQIRARVERAWRKPRSG